MRTVSFGRPLPDEGYAHWRTPTRVAMRPGGAVAQFCWHERQCYACPNQIETPDVQQRLCPDCEDEWWRWAARIGPQLHGKDWWL